MQLPALALAAALLAAPGAPGEGVGPALTAPPTTSAPATTLVPPTTTAPATTAAPPSTSPAVPRTPRPRRAPATVPPASSGAPDGGARPGSVGEAPSSAPRGHAADPAARAPAGGTVIPRTSATWVVVVPETAAPDGTPSPFTPEQERGMLTGAVLVLVGFWLLAMRTPVARLEAQLRRARRRKERHV